MLSRPVIIVALVFALAVAGIAFAPPTLPQAQAQSYGVAGTILGLAIIAGIVYLISRDHYGVYHRYYYGRYDGRRYAYEGPYYGQFGGYRTRYYRGPLPRDWHGDRGCTGGHRWDQGYCR